jgi:hypothetical protein
MQNFASLQISYTVFPTGAESIETPALRAIATGDGFLIQGLVPGEMLSVYNLQGQLIYRTARSRACTRPLYHSQRQTDGESSVLTGMG